ncbi:deoxyribonuclease IV [Litchfieldia salsa]|uniref:Endonuclease IV n=1 Tax=Litchfieldia salsa TaxID=930152 RepID=A0A1H0TDD8_9BACI|nr:deoxyribonuclease IV [Litchfieldia salsa]SDP52019.1 Endonuclease IV [Litchfieldia salsa]
MMRIGAHLSIRNGYYQAAVTAKSIGAGIYQYFPKNPRSLSVKAYDKSDTSACAEFCKKHNIDSVAHTPYPTNLSVVGEEREHVVLSLLNDLEIAEACNSFGVVVHFGVLKTTKDPLEGYLRMIETLNQVCSKWNGNCLLLIENNAGKSGPEGTTLEELVQIRKLVDYPEKIGFCFDTCHGFASGVWNGENWLELEEKGATLHYFEHLKVVHLNNSMYPTGAMKDRHANIHKGHITYHQMKTFINSAVVKSIPMVLETPSTNDFTHKDEIALINNDYC